MSLLSSPYSSKLSSNYCPNDDEVADIKLLLVQPSLRLAQIDSQLADMQTIMDALNAERNRLDAYVDAHKALLSPFRRLPLDVIHEIFLACIPTHRNCVMSASEAPVLLGRICSSWRTISLSLPRLWSRLHIVEPTLPWWESSCAVFEQKIVQRLEVTQTWLERSGNCELSISLQSHVGTADELDDMPGVPPRPGRFLQALFPFASRWKIIRLSISPSAAQTLSRFSEEDVPILTTLSIQENSFPVLPQSTEWESFGLLRGSMLRSLSITATRFDPSALPLRWDQLNHLAILGPEDGVDCRLTHTMALQILSQCPQVRACRLLVGDDPSAENEAAGLVEHALLERFDLHCIGSTPATGRQLFRRLKLPRLRFFRLRGLPEFGLTSDFTLFLGGSKRLWLLDIHTETFSKASLMNLLRMLPPTLQQLHVTHPSYTADAIDVFDDDVLAVLTTPPDGLDLPCPALQHLVMTHCCASSDEAMLRFILARMSGVGSSRKLKHISLQFARGMETDILPSLQTFIEAGLKVAITHYPPRTFTFSPWEGLPDAPSRY